jgi:hypothetical protein
VLLRVVAFYLFHTIAKKPDYAKKGRIAYRKKGLSIMIRKYIVLFLSLVILTNCQQFILPPTVEGEITDKYHREAFSDYYPAEWILRCTEKMCATVFVDQKVIYHSEDYLFVVQLCGRPRLVYVSKTDYHKYLIGDAYPVYDYFKCVRKSIGRALS